jgi:uncharacterized protein (UPF0332 family)
MSLSQEERTIVVGLELEKADKFLAQANAVAALGIWDVVANRIFYAAFHAVSALLIHDHIEVRSHKGAGLMFGQKYVIPGIFSAEDGRLYAKLQDLREKSDYNLVYQSNEEEMAPLIEKTRDLIERVKGKSSDATDEFIS